MTVSSANEKQNRPLRIVKVKKDASSTESPVNGNNGHSSKTTDPQENLSVEDMVNKGLDLAESGIGLGVNIVVRLSSILKGQVLDRFNAAEMLSSVMNNMKSDQQQAGTQDPIHQATADYAYQEQVSEQSYQLYNRLPLCPGDKFSLSFSVNNDSMDAEKAIKLEVAPFTGERHNSQIPANQLTITPAETLIAAADFEKFVLSGIVDPDLPVDTYHGWVMVKAEQEYRIPVVLEVSVAQQKPPAES